MGRSRPVYNEIRALRKQLDSEGSVKKCREAYQRLLELLSDPDTRGRLALEAIPDDDTNRKRNRSLGSLQRTALAEMWKMLLTTAVTCVQMISRGKSKLTEPDIHFPFKLLLLCNKSDSIFDESDIFAPSKLGKDQTKHLHFYCMEILGDESIINNVNGAEHTMLSMLLYICGRREFVSYFKPDNHVRAILEEVKSRLLKNDDDDDVAGFVLPSTKANALLSAKIFATLLCTCRDIGIGLQINAREIISIVASWCQQQDSFAEELPHLLSGLSVVLCSDPDLCVAPLTQNGRPILQLSKRLLAQFDLQKGATIFSALVEYLLRHLIVCQVAGKLQGFVVGDLGDLGEASLSYNTILHLLDKLIKAIGNHPPVSWEKPSNPFKLLLELTVRLLAVAQRIFLVENEWNDVEDLTEQILLHINSQQNPDDYISLDSSKFRFPSAAVSTLSDSPSVTLLLRHFCPLPPDSVSDQTNHLMVALSSSGNDTACNEKALISMLCILCASAEFFPLGNCWTSSTLRSWRVLSLPHDCSSRKYLPMLSNGCSPNDIVAIVASVSNILDKFGGHSASSQLQNWALLSLIRLAVSTDEISAYASRTECISIANVWRRVWTIILDSNHCFNSTTVDTALHSTGDLVLRLLTQMIRFCCLDVKTGSVNFFDFLTARQIDVWNLKVFEQLHMESPSAFFLLYIVVTRVGVNDFGSDSIGLSLSHTESWRNRIQQLGSGRRSKLICFCLHILVSSPPLWNDETMVSTIFACIAALGNGFSAISPVLSPSGMVTSPFLPHDVLLTDCCNTLQGLDLLTFAEPHLNCDDEFFGRLWHRPLPLSQHGAKFTTLETIENVLAVVGMVHIRVFCREFQRRTSCSIGCSDNPRFIGLALSDLRGIGTSCSRNCVDTTPGENRVVSSQEGCAPFAEFAFRVKIFKGSLTILSPKSKYLSNFLEELLEDFSRILKEASTFLLAFDKTSVEIEAALSDLVQTVRGFVFGTACFEFLFPDCLVHAVSMLYDACEESLESYVALPLLDAVGVTDVLSGTSSNDISIFDDDIPVRSVDRGVLYSMKRKLTLQGDSSTRKRLHASKNMSNPSSRQFIFLVGLLFIELNPSYKDIEFVAKKLLGMDVLEDDDLSEFDVDVNGGIFMVEILSKVDCLSPGFRCTQTVGIDNIPSLICKVIRIVRLASGAGSASHLFGYKFCADVVARCDGNLLITSLNCDQAKDLLGLLTSDGRTDRRSILHRPLLRSQLVHAATNAFHYADDNFHSEIDSLFGVTFVLPYLADLSGSVRIHASFAVGSAFARLSEEKVADSVRRRLSPVSGRKSNEYRGWCVNRNFLVEKDETKSMAENQLWGDAYDSLQYDSISCWCVMAETTSSRDILQQILFDLISAVVAHPNLEFLCFNALERICLQRGFSYVDQLLYSEIGSILKRWNESGLSFYSLPMMVCIPSTFQFVIRAGLNYVLMSGSTQSRGHKTHCDLQKVREVAISDFLRRYAKHALPLLTISSVNSVVQSAITKDGRRSLLENDLFKEYCSIAHGRYNDDVAKKTLRSFVPIILAGASFEEAIVVENLIQMLNGLLSESSVVQKCNEGASIFCRRVLEVASEITYYDCVFDAHRLFRMVFKGLNGSKSCLDMIHNAGSSIPELLAFVRYLLVTSCTDGQMILRWKSAELVFRILMEHMDQNSLGFESWYALDFLLFIALEPKLRPIRIYAFRKIKEFLQCFPKTRETEEEHQKYYLKKVFKVIMGLHRQYQNDLITECFKFHRYHEVKARRSGGFLRRKEGTSGSFGPWNWTVINRLSFDDIPFSEIWSAYNSCVSSTLVEFLIESFNIIDEAISASLLLGFSREVLGFFCVESQDAVKYAEISLTNRSFCAQHLVLNSLLMDSLSDSKYVFDVLDLQVVLSNQFLTDSAILTSELNDFAHFWRYSGGREGRFKVSASDERSLVCSLTRFCSKSFAEEIRIAASRCLGEIPLEVHQSCVIASDLSPDIDQLSMAIAGDRLLPYLQSVVVDSLASSVIHRDSRTALVAIDSLKCLLSSRGSRCFVELISDLASSSVLYQIGQNGNPGEWTKLVLSSDEINCLWLRDSIMSDEDNKEWCWDDSLWLPLHDSESSSFATWICRLVPSLLICCYDMPPKHCTSVTTNTFYNLCQRISFLDASAAQALFPCIILDLLLRDGFNCESGDLACVLADTWIGRADSKINVHLSRCFGLVLQTKTVKHYPEAIELVLDILDMLRRMTQHKFLNSSNHKMNRRSNKEARLSGSSQAVVEESYIPWRGAPFGVVLQLEGTLVANACIHTGRIEEAVFYAEVYADSCFDDSRLLSCDIRGINREQLSNRYSSRYISGFCEMDDTDFDAKSDSFSFFEILRVCYAALGDDEAREAVDQLVSDLAFGSDIRNTSALSSLARHPPSLQKLKRLDAMALRDNDSSSIRLSIVNCLDGIGLRDTLNTYMSGLMSGPYSEIASNGSICDDLREKIYECRLHCMQWDVVAHPLTEYSDSPSPVPLLDDWIPKTYCKHTPSTSGFYQCLAEALDMIRRNDTESSQKSLLSARIQFADRLVAHGSESLQLRNVVRAIDDLRTLNDLEVFVQNPDSAFILHQMTLSVDAVACNPKSISATSDCIREIVTRYYLSKKSVVSSDCWENISDSLCRRFHLNLQFKQHDEAESNLQRLDFLTQTLGDSKFRLRLPLLEAQLLESKGDYNIAIRNTKLLQGSLRKSSQARASEVLADSLVLCGEWMTRYKVEPAGTILSDYLQPAVIESLRIYNDDENELNANRATRALFANGHLAANLFDAISSRVQSLEWQNAESSLIDREAECDRLDYEANQRRRVQNKNAKASSVSSADELNNHIYRHHLRREIKATRTQRNTIVSSLEAHRTLALNSIGKALAIAGVNEPEDISKHVFRFVGIWFSSEKFWTPSVYDVTNDALQGVPSFRFVPLIAQLLSRLTNEESKQAKSFNTTLQDLIVKISHDHPYHCLLHLITLSASKHSSDINEKAHAASLILHRLSCDDPDLLTGLIESYKKLSTAYVHLATANISELKRNGASFIALEKVCSSSTLRLDKCLGLGSRKAKYLPCIFTKPPMIRPGRDYGDGISDPIGSELVEAFDSSFSVTDTGVNQPKIVVCVGTRKGRFKQLVKGSDDTRQDAVMEQVFGYANDILSRQNYSPGGDAFLSSGRVLRLVTYNVVPLNHVAGVLEWVEESTPFGDFIVDRVEKRSMDGQVTRRVAAHSRYYPGEWSSDRCRAILSQIWKDYRDTSEQDNGEGKHKENLRSAFDKICKHHTPVFRYFFVENFIPAEAWYAAKMRYTRSVAVSSIVGHILGIGDRHMSNILVHKKTGEVIHIDFGVVFEQGMRLTVPEIVPFRLTRNVIDGMGSIGVEGTFTKAAEATLSALKHNSNGLLTILSAIVSDPLYKWSLGSKKRNPQNTEEASKNEESRAQLLDNNNTVSCFMDHDENRNQVAAHAIARINEKLSGYEDGTLGEQQSVESQVQLLLNAAQSPDNLCCMYPGWAPWQ